MDKIQEDYGLYQIGMDYNNKLTPPYYKNIDVNEAFAANDHWRGVKANGQPTMILPVYRRIMDHEVAMLLSSPIKAKFSIENFEDGTKEKPLDETQAADKNKVDMLNYKLADKWEKDKIDILLRECLQDGFNTGDYAIYTYWDENKGTKQYNGIDPKTGKPVEIMGDFCNVIKDGAEIMLGNPNNREIQTQPYILVMGRDMVSVLKAKAKANKVKEEDYMRIVGDQDYQEQSGDRGKIELDASDSVDSGKCLYIIKLWRKDGEIYYRMSTKYCTIIKEQAMGLKRYPLAWGNWIKRKNSYHGTAPGTAIVPNNVAINQMYSNVVYHMRMTAFGKVIFDRTRIGENYDNAIGGAIGVEGDVTGAVQQLQPGQMNNNMFGFMGDMISSTKELNGANDAALGDVDPTQASGTAIQVTAQQNAIPLDNPKYNLYQFVEDLVLNQLDFIENNYDLPRKVGYQEKGVGKVGEINGADYKDMPLNLKIDVGPSKMWSEVTSVNTIMQLLKDGKISFVQMLERMPDGYITDKEGLIEEVKAQEQMMQQQAQMQQEQAMRQQGIQQNQQTMQGQQEQQAKEAEFEKMAQFLESLPKDVQAQIQNLPEGQQEATIMQLMKQSVNNSMKGGQ